MRILIVVLTVFIINCDHENDESSCLSSVCNSEVDDSGIDDSIEEKETFDTEKCVSDVLEEDLEDESSICERDSTSKQIFIDRSCTFKSTDGWKMEITPGYVRYCIKCYFECSL